MPNGGTNLGEVRIGVNVPNFGPGTDPGVLRRWAATVEDLGYGMLLVSDHIVVTPDVREQYPPPFYEPFTTLAWLAGITERVMLGTSVLVLPYRHPLQVARAAANIADLSGGRLVLGVGTGWARQEYVALGVPFERRGALTDAYLATILDAWRDRADYRGGDIPLWIGGNTAAGMRRAVRFGGAWHPLRFTLAWFLDAVGRLAGIAADAGRPTPALAPRIVLRLTDTPLTDTPLTGPDRRAGEGTLEQVLDDLDRLEKAGAESVVLDPYDGDTSIAATEEALRALRLLAHTRKGLTG
jgi:alkanesulfonate monooxygenase SsuD/methylene tetrahydromethanopterin reductase-like flavin-dependent oxidoreductase (luciferase family)